MSIWVIVCRVCICMLYIVKDIYMYAGGYVYSDRVCICIIWQEGRGSVCNSVCIVRGGMYSPCIAYEVVFIRRVCAWIVYVCSVYIYKSFQWTLYISMLIIYTIERPKSNLKTYIYIYINTFHCLPLKLIFDTIVE